jgi:uncharacterized protein YdeI (YjbR/CyaY-like superfamily)
VSETVEGAPTLYARDLSQWRDWLAANGRTRRVVWLIVYKKGSGVPGVSFHDAIEHALCYGWVDSKAVRRDLRSCYLCFTPRNPRSTWGRANRERAQRMIDAGFMTPSGQALIDLARQTGTWDALASAQDGTIPDDLDALFDAHPVARENFERFPPSSRRLILQWIATAKRPDTRDRRLRETVSLAEENIRANHPRPRRRA